MKEPPRSLGQERRVWFVGACRELTRDSHFSSTLVNIVSHKNHYRVLKMRQSRKESRTPAMVLKGPEASPAAIHPQLSLITCPILQQHLKDRAGRGGRGREGKGEGDRGGRVGEGEGEHERKRERGDGMGERERERQRQRYQVGRELTI